MSEKFGEMVSLTDFNHFLAKFDQHGDKLHFAFMFASPLVLQSSNNFKLMPLLNFSKEYDAVITAIDDANYRMTIQKRQCTRKKLLEILQKKPLGMHFSGHGLLNKPDEIGEDLYNTYKGQGDLLLLETEQGSS